MGSYRRELALDLPAGQSAFLWGRGRCRRCSTRRTGAIDVRRCSTRRTGAIDVLPWDVFLERLWGGAVL